MTIFVQKFNAICKKIWCFLQENLSNFAGKFEDFAETFWKFSYETLIIFAEKFDGICRKIWWFFQENMTISTGKFDDLYRKFDDFCRKIQCFLRKNMMILARRADNFFRKIWQSVYIKIHCFSVLYLKKLELLDRLHSFINQFVRYTHRKVYSYPVFNIFAQHVWKYSLSYLPICCTVNSLFFHIYVAIILNAWYLQTFPWM